jgi:hypothetical protein
VYAASLRHVLPLLLLLLLLLLLPIVYYYYYYYYYYYITLMRLPIPQLRETIGCLTDYIVSYTLNWKKKAVTVTTLVHL